MIHKNLAVFKNVTAARTANISPILKTEPAEKSRNVLKKGARFSRTIKTATTTGQKTLQKSNPGE